MSNDHRIFGFNELGQVRANLYHGSGRPYAGAMYSWLVCSAPKQLVSKLADQWEQPLSEEEFDVLEQLETSSAEPSPYTAESEIDCDECGGSGVDPGGLNAYEPEDCPVCHGTKHQTVTRNYLGEAFALASGQSSRQIEREHLAALDAYSRQLMSAYAQKVAA
jgi:hypothetical protein